ncbi:unnamed protein product [Protopolystoma xenopodis]|uniref:Uncharacterized protein n=1 Tax=Protopolystoma xenopodis TaxID=117903 RepID=A0A3S5B963_9PLAT|nr:unnamed protein product [Protopolystoma xenopodis]
MLQKRLQKHVAFESSLSQAANCRLDTTQEFRCCAELLGNRMDWKKAQATGSRGGPGCRPSEEAIIEMADNTEERSVRVPSVEELHCGQTEAQSVSILQISEMPKGWHGERR